MSVVQWLNDLNDYIRSNSYGLASIRVLDFNNATFGIIDPYGYYIVNVDSAIYLLRDNHTLIKFQATDGTVTTSLVNSSRLTVGYIDNLFLNPPPTTSQLVKFVLFRDKMPRRYTAIELINRCLDLRILSI